MKQPIEHRITHVSGNVTTIDFTPPAYTGKKFSPDRSAIVHAMIDAERADRMPQSAGYCWAQGRYTFVTRYTDYLKFLLRLNASYPEAMLNTDTVY